MKAVSSLSFEIVFNPLVWFILFVSWQTQPQAGTWEGLLADKPPRAGQHTNGTLLSQEQLGSKPRPSHAQDLRAETQ